MQVELLFFLELMVIDCDILGTSISKWVRHAELLVPGLYHPV